MKEIIYSVCLIVVASSCISYETLVNFDEGPRFPSGEQEILNFEPIKIQKDDILSITVHNIDREAVEPFNLINASGAGGIVNRESLQLTGYLVDQEGNIDFPQLGQLKVVNMTLSEIKEEVRNQLVEKGYLKDPVINVRILNFRVKVMGEVARPGVYPFTNERISIMEVISLAGDLTQYADRDSILIVREQAGEQSFGYINLNASSSFKSPYFFLQQNDLLYIRPLRRKVNTVRDPSQNILPWVSAITSFVAFVIAIVR